MKKISNFLMILIMPVVLFGAGGAVLAARLAKDNGTAAEYNRYIESARERAAKGIYYYAKSDYLKAFGIYNGDRELFREFLQFLRDTGDGSYEEYLKIYMGRYPGEAEPYDILCEIYYNDGRYKDVQTVLSRAQAEGASSETLAKYYDLTRYEFTFLEGGYADMSPFYGNQSIIEKNGKKGLYYYGSKVLLNAEYDELSYYVNGALAARKDGECYFIDVYGNKSGVLNREVDTLSMLSNGLAAVSVDGKYSYVTADLVVPDNLPYDYATPFSENVAAVKTGGKWGIIDSQARFIAEPQYDDIKLTEFGTCISAGVIFAGCNGGYVMLNANGERLNEYVFDEACTFAVSAQPAAVKLDGKWTFVQNSGELCSVETELAAAKSFDSNLAPVSLDGERWGYMDLRGNIVIEPQFDDCLQFSAYGIAPVKMGELWSVIQLLMYK